MQSIRRNYHLVLWVSAIVAVGCLAATQRLAQAQNPLAGWPDQDFTVDKPEKVSYIPRDALKSGKFDDDEDAKKFENYYKKAVFPNVTNPANRQSPRDDVILRLRGELKTCEKAEDKQVFNKLADLILDYMTKIAGDSRYHPAARENAMLAIGEVNSPKAAKVLLDTAFGKGQVFLVRVNAMTGLIRMAGPGERSVLADPGIEPLVLQNMVPFIKFHPTKRDDGISWMRGQAAEVLADLKSCGPEGEVPRALLAMLSDKDLPVPLRSKAARALGKLNYGGNPPAAKPYLIALADFASDALGENQPVDRARVRLIARDVLDGLKPFEGSTVSSDQGVIEGLQKALSDLNKETEDSKIEPANLKAAMEKAKAVLDGLLKNKKP
jgi:hypothetical protein